MVRRAGGIGIYTCDGVETIVETRKCCHCQAPIEIPDPRKLTDYCDWCRNCGSFHCLKQECFTCTPFMKRIEQQEEKFYREQQFRKSMGF